MEFRSCSTASFQVLDLMPEVSSDLLRTFDCSIEGTLRPLESLHTVFLIECGKDEVRCEHWHEVSAQKEMKHDRVTNSEIWEAMRVS